MSGRSRGISLSYLYTLLSTIIGLFMSAFIIRVIGQTEYGVYQTMTSFASYLALFEFGTGTIMTRNISLCKKDGSDALEIEKNISTIWSIVQIITVVLVVVSICFYFSIDTLYSGSLTADQIFEGKIIFAIISVKLIVGYQTQTLNGILLGYEHYSMSTLVSLTYLIVRTTLLIGLLLRFPSPVLLVTIDTILTVISFLYTIIYCKVKFKVKFTLKYFDYQIFKLILPLALAMFLQTIVNMANGNVDKFIIGIIMSPEAVSIYSVGMFIYTTFSSLTTIPISMYMPQIAKEMKNGKKEMELTKLLVQPCRLIVCVGGVILFGFIAIGKQFITIVYGSNYLDAWMIAVIIMIPMYINMSNGIIVNVLDVLRKRQARSICLLFTTILNIILTIIFITRYGIVGAAVATAIATIIGQDIIMNIYYSKVLKLKIIYLFKESFRGLLPVLILSCIFGIIITFVFNNEVVSFLLGGITFCIVFLFGIFLLPSNKYEKDRLKILVLNMKSVSNNIRRR